MLPSTLSQHCFWRRGESGRAAFIILLDALECRMSHQTYDTILQEEKGRETDVIKKTKLNNDLAQIKRNMFNKHRVYI